jgi:hypothetical protein
MNFIATAAALLGVMAAMGPVEAAQVRSDGQRYYGNNSVRQFNGNRGREFSNWGHRNRTFRFGIPQIRFYSGESNGCTYSYRKWQATGSAYWRSRYYDCHHG